MSNLMISYIRTGVPIVVGALIAWLIAHGLSLDDSIRQPVTEALVALCIAGWYGLARGLEHLRPPWGRLFGYMLGVPARPTYPGRHVGDPPARP